MHPPRTKQGHIKKKVEWHTSLGDISIEEQGLLRQVCRVRPFVKHYCLYNKTYSRRLSKIIVDFAAESSFRHKELRVGVQQRHNEVDWKYSVGFSIDDIEKQMRRMARVLGVNNKTKVHCIGDGAVWIKELTDRIYGKKASYLVDFFHMAEYLYQASELCGDGARDIWFTHAQERMKTGRQEEVMVDLTTAHSIDPSHRGVAECRRYMQN